MALLFLNQQLPLLIILATKEKQQTNNHNINNSNWSNYNNNNDKYSIAFSILPSLLVSAPYDMQQHNITISFNLKNIQTITTYYNWYNTAYGSIDWQIRTKEEWGYKL